MSEQEKERGLVHEKVEVAPTIVKCTEKHSAEQRSQASSLPEATRRQEAKQTEMWLERKNI